MHKPIYIIYIYITQSMWHTFFSLTPSLFPPSFFFLSFFFLFFFPLFFFSFLFFLLFFFSFSFFFFLFFFHFFFFFFPFIFFFFFFFLFFFFGSFVFFFSSDCGGGHFNMFRSERMNTSMYIYPTYRQITHPFVNQKHRCGPKPAVAAHCPCFKTMAQALKSGWLTSSLHSVLFSALPHL